MKTTLQPPPGAARLLLSKGLLADALALLANPGAALANDEDDGDGDDRRGGRFCTRTAELVFQSCGFEIRDDHAKARAICINVSDPHKRHECFRQAKQTREDDKQLCQAQFAGRRDACKLLGEGRYDPPFDPASLETDFARLANPNRYFPLAVGNEWEYSKGAESNVVEVLNQTKLIDGVTCVVVDDQVRENGQLIEDTDDWYAQARNGDVYYCGEEVRNFESFDGDRPKRPELVNTDGSFKWGRNGDKGGIFFRAAPRAGDAYLEEFSLGNAEDVTEVLTTTYAYGSNPALDRFVPRALAQRFCRGECIVTKNYSLLEPGVFGLKYYGAGIGLFLEVNPESGEVSQLVNCNFDSRCGGLAAK